jgi:hypothetical protein
MAITTAFCSSAKVEFFAGAHCFQATVTPTGTTVNTNFTLTALSSTAGIVVGMAVSGTGIAAGSVVASIDSSTQITISKAATASNSGVTFTIAGDTFKIALFKQTVSGTYGAATVNYTDMTGNSDEVSGTGYSAGGTTLTNVTAVIGGTTAYINFSPNPSWAAATLSTDGCMIYNTGARLGGTSGTNTQGAGRAVGVFYFGSTQTVVATTLTIILPSATSTTAIFRLA